MIPSRQRCQGFTIVEVMGSVLVFMFGITAVLAVYIATMRMSKESTYVYAAHNLAKQHLEELRATTFSDLAAAAELDTVLDADGEANPDGEYHRATTVTTPFNGHADLAAITVTVQYTSHGAVNTTPVSLSTVIVG